ncbi:Pectinesterase inhibitor [Cardamine amara subsp. amara]|uniref:Pectinesterase inhibitor n=1 Tax=Cardamine amara subsp. amara TaxID=228776 RepID=A0ABD1A6V6_CARAN
MVAYVKNNILLGLTTILILFVVSSFARFSMEVTESEVNNICTQQGINNASFCFEVLRLSPEIATLDLSGLAKFVINYNSRITSDMLKQFQSHVNSTTDPSSKGAYIYIEYAQKLLTLLLVILMTL